LQAPAIKGVTATTAMVALGKALYFDPRLSQSDNISCNTCRQIGLGGAAPSALHVRLIVALMRSQIAPAQTIGTVKRRKLQ
jgi:cytochrome c peroxidase